MLQDDTPAARAAWSAREMDAERMQPSAVRSEALVEDDTQGERSFGFGPTAPILEAAGRCSDEIQEVLVAGEWGIWNHPSVLSETLVCRADLLQHNVPFNVLYHA